MKVMVTGHRNIGTPASQCWVKERMEAIVESLSAGRYRMDVGISGMAMGADMMWADAVLAAGAELWAFIPFRGQELLWPDRFRDHYQGLRRMAAKEIVFGDHYDKRLYHARNDAMLAEADAVVAVWDRRRGTGGTVSVVEKAKKASKLVFVIDPAAREAFYPL